MEKIIGGCLFLVLVLSASVSAEEAAAIAPEGAFQLDTFAVGATLFSDRAFVVKDCPDALKGKPFLRGNIDSRRFRVTDGGGLTVLTPDSDELGGSQVDELEAAGFSRVGAEALFQLFGDKPYDRVRTYQKKVTAGEHYLFGKWVVVLGFSSAKKWEPPAWHTNTGELLYNGIRLPEKWPPTHIEPKGRKPMPVPYLDDPPQVIPIDVGRQLFVDDFLIEKTDLTRTFHYPEKHAGNPVLKPETALEAGPTNQQAAACPKSGGLWWDPDTQRFELWYEAGWLGTIAYATSTNGLDWERPELDILPGSNQVLPVGLHPDSWTVVRDGWTDNPAEKYKMMVREYGHGFGAMCFVSPDGIHWGEFVRSGFMGDRSTLFYNPFRKKWVFSIRSGFRGRSRHYLEGDDFLEASQWPGNNLEGNAPWEEGQPVVWAAADELDLPDPYIGETPQLYNLDAVAYESIMLGFYQIWRGPPNPKHDALGIPKITELNFAYSRDGFHWHRPDRNMAIQAERKPRAWDRGYVQSLGNICVLMGDKIWFYYTAFAGDESRPGGGRGAYSNAAMGMASLRRDGFVSMATERTGMLTTRPVSFGGKNLFINADVPDGALSVEVLDEKGHPIEPFTMENCISFSGDSTIQNITWEGGGDLSALHGRSVRFRFKLEKGALYSFWVSKDRSGRSDGFVAGGGPGYTGPTDTVGAAALCDKVERNLE